MSDGRKETTAVELSELRLRYREILKEFASSTRIPGIELVAETCHGGQFCHGGSTKNLPFEELIQKRLDQTLK